MLRYLPAVCVERRAVITNTGVLYSLEADFFDDETEDQPASESTASSVEGFSPYEYFDTEPTVYAEKTAGLELNQSNQLKNLLNSVLNETVPIAERQNALKQAFSLLKQKDFTQQPFWLVPTIIELLKQSTCVPLLLEAMQGLGNIKPVPCWVFPAEPCGAGKPPQMI